MRGLPVTDGLSWEDYNSKEVWSEIKASDTFWMTLGPTQEMIDKPKLWVALNAISPFTYFVTSRIGNDVRRQTEYWLNSHGVRRPMVIISNHKGEIAHAVRATHMLDDKPEHVILASKQATQCVPYILDTPYNQFDHGVVGKRVIRVKSVEEFMREVWSE